MASAAENVLTSLKRVIEPDWGINIVDLGLVYGITVNGDAVDIEMTFPKPDADARTETERRLRTVVQRRHPELVTVNVLYVNDPEWREDFMTPEGEMQLRTPMAAADLDVPLTEEDVMDSLRLVPDPEVALNIVDLGLIYGVDISPEGDVDVEMTLTTPGCPLHASIEDAVNRVLETRHPDVGRITVNLVWEPAWDTDRISDYGRTQLGWA